MSRLASPVDEAIENRGVAKAVGELHVASLLFTYRCSIACKHCLFNCSPAQTPVRTSLKDGIKFLAQLMRTDRVVHVAGGEPMLFYRDLFKVWSAAQERGVSPHFFETNAYWCTTDSVTRSRYEKFREVGCKGVLISADPYHLAHVPVDYTLRARRIAMEVFGEENVMANPAPRDELERMVAIGSSDALLAEHVGHHAPRLVGRAGDELAKYLHDRPIEELARDPLWHGDPAKDGSCSSEFDPRGMWEIHVDPYGNIQTCCGIILGNAHETPIPEVMETGLTHGPVARAVYEGGPFELLEMAIELGYQPGEGYPQKCALCWEVRKYLRPYYPAELGPDEIYGQLPGGAL